jgi:hypothetical protein
MSSEKKRGRGRPRSFQLVQNAHGKVGGRVTRTIDGETVRKRVKLETTDDAVARIKLRRLARDTTAPVEVASSDETFLEEAERIGKLRVKAGKVRAGEELGKIVRHAGALHDMPVTSVTSDDINMVLDAAQAAGKSKNTVKNLKVAISVVFAALVRDRASPVKNNPARGASLPEYEKKFKKIRAVLEDAELFVYLAFIHPIPFHQIAVFQRQVMSIVARCLGGQRTNDLHESRWEQFVIAGGEFASALVVRTKGQQLERMVVPPILRPFLRAWWIQQGRPTSGLIFPTLRGERLGEVKRKVSHAKAFRKDLRRAFGVEVWNAKKVCFVTARELTERERELFVESKFTKPVDFHSWRRAFVQAVDGVDLDAKDKRKLSGHEDEAVRQVYLQSTKRREWVVPASALPVRPEAEPAAPPAPAPEPAPEPPAPELPPTPAPEQASGGILGQLPAFIQESGVCAESDSVVITATSSARPGRFERPTFGSVVRQESDKSCETVESGHGADDDDETITPSRAESGLNRRPKIGTAPALSESDLTDLLALATQKKKWALVASLSTQLEALAAAKADTGVTDIADARKRRDERGGDKP